MRVAVTGIDGAGKSTLADELGEELNRRGRPVVRASIDDFERPRAERYRRGAESPTGYYRDSFNFPALRDMVLAPLGPGGTHQYRRSLFDLAHDAPVPEVWEVAPADAVAVIDGVFLGHPTLSAFWDYRILVDTPKAVALERAVARDLAAFESREALVRRYTRRYFAGQALYAQEVDLARWPDAVVGVDASGAVHVQFRGRHD